MSEKKNRLQPTLEELKGRHESDLSAKERRRLERAAFKDMDAKAKLQYFWDYYKWTLLVVLFVIVAIHEGIGIYHRSKQIILLSIGIMDSPLYASEGVARFSEDLTSFLGTGDPYETIETDTALMSGNDSHAVTKRAVVVGAGLTDILIIGEEYFEELDAEEAFISWQDILGDDYQSYAALFDDSGRLELSQNPVWKTYGITEYTPVYLAVLERSERLENARKIPEFFSRQ